MKSTLAWLAAVTLAVLFAFSGPDWLVTDASTSGDAIPQGATAPR